MLAVNKKSGLQATELKDLTSPAIKQIAIANPEHAPYGVAAMQAMQAAGVWEQVKPKLVYGENVRQTLQYIQTGDAPVGIVALSVANVPEITWTLIDDKLHQPLNQALAVIKRSPRAEAAPSSDAESFRTCGARARGGAEPWSPSQRVGRVRSRQS